MEELKPFLMENRAKAEFERQLLSNINGLKKQLQELLCEVSGSAIYEEGFYRFYHQSFKVFRLQRETEKIVAMLERLLPDRPLNSWFQQIVQDGTGKQFDMSQNENWLTAAKPILEAFFHAKCFLEIATRQSEQVASGPTLEQDTLPTIPNVVTSGWAVLLRLYNIR